VSGLAVAVLGGSNGGYAAAADFAHRYVTEDVALGLTLWMPLAARLEVAAPVSRAILTLARPLFGRALAAERRTLEHLELARLDARGLRRFPHDGAELG
jgi:opine dehydrogenase